MDYWLTYVDMPPFGGATGRDRVYDNSWSREKMIASLDHAEQIYQGWVRKGMMPKPIKMHEIMPDGLWFTLRDTKHLNQDLWARFHDLSQRFRKLRFGDLPKPSQSPMQAIKARASSDLSSQTDHDMSTDSWRSKCQRFVTLGNELMKEHDEHGVQMAQTIREQETEVQHLRAENRNLKAELEDLRLETRVQIQKLEFENKQLLDRCETQLEELKEKIAPMETIDTAQYEEEDESKGNLDDFEFWRLRVETMGEDEGFGF